jgi:hypothetical protein
MIFVFGSNEAGVHGSGAAKTAIDEQGAIYGQGIGLQGNSYGIPTKDWHIKTLPLERIREYVQDFKDFATDHPELEFQVTQIGCGLAGLKPEEIAPMFDDSPDNCQFDSAWQEWLGSHRTYWGTFPNQVAGSSSL